MVQGFKTEHLSSVVDNSKTINFDIKVSDGKTILSNAIPVTILLYKPELTEARITSIIASTYLTSDYPEYIIDGNVATKWSSNGVNQWLLLTLAVSFRISHFMIAFLQEQNYESYFDIYDSISEFKIFGIPQQVSNSIDHKGNSITIYLNPTKIFFNISINEPDYNLNSIRIIDISGKIVFEYPCDHIVDNIQLRG
jgi:hypothetical protein